MAGVYFYQASFLMRIEDVLGAQRQYGIFYIVVIFYEGFAQRCGSVSSNVRQVGREHRSTPRG